MFLCQWELRFTEFLIGRILLAVGVSVQNIFGVAVTLS